MFPSHILLSLFLFASKLTAVDASPVRRTPNKATLSLFTRTNELGTVDIVGKDLARARGMQQVDQLGKRSVSFNITNSNFGYTAQVGVGSPPTKYTLIIDSGSANTWVGANKSYVKTSTSHDTGHNVSLRYGSGSFTGEEWTDTLTLAPGLVIEQQSIGVANQSVGLGGLDGILGLAPINVTQGTVSDVDLVPTVADNLFSQKKISQEVMGINFIPAVVKSKSGELTFGGYDETALIPPLLYVPLTKTSPASRFWGIDQSVNYGNETILPVTAGVIDTGTTLVLLASDAFQKYKNMTGATLDSATGFYRITPEQYDNLGTLTFIIGGIPYELTPNAQTWPRSLNSLLNGADPNAIYLLIGDIGSPSGQGLDFVMGYAFLARYYTVLDATSKAVGFAATRYTYSACH